MPGRIVERADKAVLFADPRHPYTLALLDSIPPLDGPRPAPPAAPSQARRRRSLNLPKGCAFAPRCPHRLTACDEAKPPLVGGAHAAACILPSAR